MRRGIIFLIISIIIISTSRAYSGQKGLLKISTDKTRYTEGETIKLKIDPSKRLKRQRKIRQIEIRYPWGEKEWKRIKEEIEVEKEAKESKGYIEVGVKKSIAKILIPLLNERIRRVERVIGRMRELPAYLRWWLGAG